MEVVVRARNKPPLNFKPMPLADVPQGRQKHQDIVTKILSNLERAPKGYALKVPLAQLKDTKKRVRAALGRAARKHSRQLATASDEQYPIRLESILTKCAWSHRGHRFSCAINSEVIIRMADFP